MESNRRPRQRKPPAEPRTLEEKSMDTTGTRNTDVFARYGLRRIVNASGTETTKGASPVCPEVIAAVSELVAHSVEMAELQSVACHVITSAVGAEAGDPLQHDPT